MTKVRPVQLVEAGEGRLLVEDVKRVKGGVWVEHEQRSKQGEKENKTERKEKETTVRELEEKENRVGRKEEQAVNSWRRSVAVAPRK